MEHLPGRSCRFQILTAVVPQSEVQALSGRGLLRDIGVPVELIADCGADEIAPIRVESFLDHQVDMPEVDVAEVDRDLFGVAALWAKFMHSCCHVHHPNAIQLDGTWQVSPCLSRVVQPVRSRSGWCRRTPPTVSRKVCATTPQPRGRELPGTAVVLF